MNQEDEALKLALEALEWEESQTAYPSRMMTNAITAIKQALAQPAPVQEPVVWRWSESKGERWFGWTTDWSHHDKAKLMAFPIEYAYTTPPAAQRQWVGLTDEEIEKACVPLGAAMLSFTEVARAIEAKLKEKNT
jgi:hypothetical protein